MEGCLHKCDAPAGGQLRAAPGEVVRAWVIQTTMGLSGAVTGQEHQEHSGANMGESLADKRREQKRGRRDGKWPKQSFVPSPKPLISSVSGR